MLPQQTTSDLEYYKDGLKNSLVCVDGQDLRKTVATVLRELDYNVQVAPDAEDTYEKIKYNQYDCIVLNDSFSGGTGDNNEIVDYLQTMPITSRRLFFIVLIGSNYKTMDNMAAFSKSVNLVVNEHDMTNFKTILKRAIGENDLFYRTFKNVMVELGKA
ncbi:MAG: hypothetical protein HQK89_01090 [Nitrospirae bacterium]|nr:hypothetical protein [Nitrospirota bacterium]